MDASEHKDHFYVYADNMTRFGPILDLGITKGPTTSYEGDPNDYKPIQFTNNMSSGYGGYDEKDEKQGGTGKTIATAVGITAAAVLLGWLGSKMINNAHDKNEGNKAVSLQSLKTQENLARIQADAQSKKNALDARTAPLIAAQQAKAEQAKTNTIIAVTVGGVLLLGTLVVVIAMKKN